MTSIHLDSVKQAFQQWRVERRNSVEPIPDTLWSMALSLFPQHKRSHICRHLGLNGGQFTQRLNQTKNCGAAKPSGFVLASSSPQQPTSTLRPDVQISISGTRTLTISACVEDLEYIIPHISGLL